MKKDIPKIAIVRGKFLNQYEMQSFEPLTNRFDITAFGSLTPLYDQFTFPVVTLPSPMDIPEFPYKMPILNRLFTDAHYLIGLENKLQGFDIAHCAETYYHFTIQCLNAKKKRYVKKVVSTVWENIPFNNEGIHGRYWFKKRAIAEVDHFIAMTHQAREALITEGCDKKKISVVYPGIDTKRFVFKKEQKKQSTHILFVGRLEKEKGVWTIFEAFKKLYRVNPSLRITFCGSGSQEQKLLEAIKNAGLSHTVTVTSSSYDTLPFLYQMADIVVVASHQLPHWKEQFGMVLIEAMASGVPIVASSTGAIPEVVGDAGIVLKDTSVDSFASAILHLSSSYHKRNQRAHKGIQRVKRFFDRIHTSKELLKCYNSLMVYE